MLFRVQGALWVVNDIASSRSQGGCSSVVTNKANIINPLSGCLHLTMLFYSVPNQVVTTVEGTATDVTPVRSSIAMYTLVHSQVRTTSEGLVAYITIKHFDSLVSTDVNDQMIISRKGTSTHITSKWPLACMQAPMQLQVRLLTEITAARLTSVHLSM